MNENKKVDQFTIYLKKIYACLLVCGLIPVIGSAQTGHSSARTDFDVYEFITKRINIPAAQSNINLSHISGITVVDARADTFPVGFAQGALDYETPNFISLEEGVENATSKFVNKYFLFSGNDSNVKVVMVLKKLWLTDELGLPNENAKSERIYPHNKPDGTPKDQWSSGIIASIDFYLKNHDDYYPLYHYDSIMHNELSVSKNGRKYLQSVLISSLSKLVGMEQHFGELEGKRKLSWEEINKYNDKRFNIPILQDSILHAGVYMTYDEFKNNNPSFTHYELKKKKEAKDIYITAPDGKEYLERNMWGYCDGENIFIRSMDYFFVLQKINNAFYIYGGKREFVPELQTMTTYHYLNGTAVPSTMSVPTKNVNNYPFVLEPLMLDWDKGNLY